mmetsp:Transcript_36650/g.62401  ORF Transcript_36650/g.62401 Transcript_36650/m.62401 type:complete len:225 (+) Transcript_36650:152-826(+)|eukprot:CAMPEP_0183733670 /NCGR_PEP_ID=MMETSP0737-20130205/41689_1 /TAXON_ID=385413 /ORGANISM="Thalassiosira miniscula, Strain CCMP1093" /LENGTH=224 /DNA_ID=CAMNT_0025966965 /DNA_START=134 /DNA_END=808 /DNA_ORIENTATION=-
MEVVSPLTFARNQGGGKRRFGSPMLGTSVAGNNASTATEDFDMDDSGFGFQATKRRKRFSNEGGGFQTKENNWTMSPFHSASSRSPNSHVAGLPSTKRSRTSQHDDASAQKLQELQHMVQQQAAEIERLKSEKESAQASATQLSSQHAKVEGENKILKRAVAIQQERQNHMNAELEGARQFKAQAEDRIRRLEQMNLTLQYQLQANSATGNDFMAFNPRPPDVY